VGALPKTRLDRWPKLPPRSTQGLYPAHGFYRECLLISAALRAALLAHEKQIAAPSLESFAALTHSANDPIAGTPIL
tara:strand:+ start:2016 stop:2246 length:231 start_codon:yes stop_codon:yes gene_type:complete